MFLLPVIYAKKATSSPDFNALMGVLAQYLINTQPAAPQPQQKSWFRRFHDYWTTTPAQKAAAEQQQRSAFQRRQFLSAAAPFVGRIANAYVPGSGDLVTSGLLALGRKLGFGRRRRGGKFKRGKRRN